MPVYEQGGPATGSDPIWYSWNTTTTASTTTDVVWTNWNITSTATITPTYTPTYSEEDQRRWREQAAERQRQDKERGEKRAQAEVRANVLLRSLLDDQQWEDWKKKRLFLVRGSDGGWYRIRHGIQGNIDQLNDQGQCFARLCIHPNMETPDGRLPVTDAVIAQLLSVRTDEAEFRRVANITPYALAA